jgi:homeodomain-containing protein
MNKKYVVKLTEAERTGLQKLIATGKAAARKRLLARISLKTDMSSQGSWWSDGEISEALEVSPATIQRVRQQFVEQGLTAALERHLPRGQRIRRLDGEGEAHLIALTCSSVPTGHNRWTIRLLAKKLVELGYVERVGRETVRQVLKKRAQALAQGAVVHSPQSACGICL